MNPGIMKQNDPSIIENKEEESRTKKDHQPEEETSDGSNQERLGTSSSSVSKLPDAGAASEEHVDNPAETENTTAAEEEETTTKNMPTPRRLSITSSSAIMKHYLDDCQHSPEDIEALLQQYQAADHGDLKAVVLTIDQAIVEILK
jgi:hypothetical protein